MAGGLHGPGAAAAPGDHLRNQPPFPGGSGAAIIRATRTVASDVPDRGRAGKTGAHGQSGHCRQSFGQRRGRPALPNCSKRSCSGISTSSVRSRFNNKTNGITPRRWLLQMQPGSVRADHLRIGRDWVCDLDRAAQAGYHWPTTRFPAAVAGLKLSTRSGWPSIICADWAWPSIPTSLFDCQFKRIHEYKRQLLNVLHVITLYHRLKDNPSGRLCPRTVIFGGKAAPGYFMAKLIIKLINSVAEVINNDPASERPAQGGVYAQLLRLARPRRSSRPPIFRSRSPPPARRPRAPAT